MSIDTCTTVDVLIERLQTHPEEFFDKALVSVSGAKDIVAGTKWQLGGLLGTAGSAYGDMRLMDKYDQMKYEAMRRKEEAERVQQLAEAQQARSGLLGKFKNWL